MCLPGHNSSPSGRQHAHLSQGACRAIGVGANPLFLVLLPLHPSLLLLGWGRLQVAPPEFALSPPRALGTLSPSQPLLGWGCSGCCEPPVHEHFHTIIAREMRDARTSPGRGRDCSLPSRPCKKPLKTGDSRLGRVGNRRELPAGFRVASLGW